VSFKTLILSCLLIWTTLPCNAKTFIAQRKDLPHYYGKSDYVLIASTGRSGSTMLTEQMLKFMPKKKVLKTHLLLPSRDFKGKILFIFSNPDQAAESALFMTLHKRGFGSHHFVYVETADRTWYQHIGGSSKQNLKHNLLSYDALGTAEHLQAWLHDQVKASSPDRAQILAIKYENLWDVETMQAIRNFLNLPDFELPAKRSRGHQNLHANEIAFRQAYNLGTEEDPIYTAYDEARVLWEQAPPFQFLKINR